MPSRYRNLGPSHSNDFHIHQDETLGPTPPATSTDPAREHRRVLSPPSDSINLSNRSLPRASPGGMNTLRKKQPAAKGKPVVDKAATATKAITNGAGVQRAQSTIRTVPSFDDRDRERVVPSDNSSADSDASPSFTKNSNSVFSSSVNSTASAQSIYYTTQQPDGDQTPDARSRRGDRSMTADTSTPAYRTRSPPPQPRGASETPSKPSTNSYDTKPSPVAPNYGLPQSYSQGGDLPGAVGMSNLDAPAMDSGLSSSPGSWDPSNGKAGQGKTGRVINKLVTENEALKRDIKIERIKSEENRNAAKLLKDKMDQTVEEYESRLFDANLNKTLLTRKERQVETLQAAVELEKKRAAQALEREQSWRDEMEKVRTETKRQVEEAQQHAAMMEGRYNAISSHWKDQGDEAKRAMSKMGKEFTSLRLEREQDDQKINSLRELGDQQNSNIADLQRQKDDISRKFDEYKAEQEGLLKDIKESAKRRQAEQEKLMEETVETLHKMKWVVNVKQNVEGAQ